MLINEISEVQNACPICHGSEFINKSTASYGSKVYLQKVVCPKCDLIYAKVRPKWDWMAKNVYASTAFDPESTIEGRRYRRYKNIAEVFKKVIPECATLLDVGAGSGTGTKAFFDAGFEVVGIEPDSRANSIKDSFNERFYILPNTIEEYNQQSKSRQFDVVTFVHCLEHIYDPRSVLKSIAHAVRNDGYLYIEVPDKKNISFFDWSHLPHISYFSYASLVTLMAEIGFTPHSRVYPKTRPYGPTHLAVIFKKTQNVSVNLPKLIAEEATHQDDSNEGVSFQFQVDKPIVFETAIIQEQLNSLKRAHFEEQPDHIDYQYSIKSEQSKGKLLSALLFILRVSPPSLIKYGSRLLVHKIKSRFTKDSSYENFKYSKYANL